MPTLSAAREHDAQCVEPTPAEGMDHTNPVFLLALLFAFGILVGSVTMAGLLVIVAILFPTSTVLSPGLNLLEICAVLLVTWGMGLIVARDLIDIVLAWGDHSTRG